MSVDVDAALARLATLDAWVREHQRAGREVGDHGIADIGQAAPHPSRPLTACTATLRPEHDGAGRAQCPAGRLRRRATRASRCGIRLAGVERRRHPTLRAGVGRDQSHCGGARRRRTRGRPEPGAGRSDRDGSLVPHRRPARDGRRRAGSGDLRRLGLRCGRRGLDRDLAPARGATHRWPTPPGGVAPDDRGTAHTHDAQRVGGGLRGRGRRRPGERGRGRRRVVRRATRQGPARRHGRAAPPGTLPARTTRRLSRRLRLVGPDRVRQRPRPPRRLVAGVVRR